MKKNNLLILFFSALYFTCIAQNRVTLLTQKVQPGQFLTFRYTPPDSLFSATDKIQCLAYTHGTYNDDAAFAIDRHGKPVEVILTKKGTFYEGTLRTDTFTCMVSLTFSSGNLKWKLADYKPVLVSGKMDHNMDSGYLLPLYTKEGKECRFANYFMARYLTEYHGNRFGFDNREKAVQYLLKELELYPDAMDYVENYFIQNIGRHVDEPGKIIISREIEKLYATGLRSSKELRLMAHLSIVNELRQQYHYFDSLANLKVKDSHDPEDLIQATVSNFFEDTILVNKDSIFHAYIRQWNQPGIGFEEKLELQSPAYMSDMFLASLTFRHQTDSFRTYASKFDFANSFLALNPNYNWYVTMMMDSLEVDKEGRGVARETAQQLLKGYVNMLSNASDDNAFANLIGKEYATKDEAKNDVATAAAALADICSQTYVADGEDSMAWIYAKQSRMYLQMQNRQFVKDPLINTHYCVLAEKYLSAAECREEIAKIVSSGEWQPEVLDILKRVWVKEKGTEAGYDAYVLSLRSQSVKEAQKTLMATRLDYAAPSFILKDLNGNTVDSKDLKGKTIVLDFWATWCGPCKASFPGMQKAATAYKDDPNVKFLFVDTWEGTHGETITNDEKRQAAAEFIKSHNYNFHVVLDNESKVVTDFKVTGIPTKFIIDKNGNVRYKVVGYEANEGKLLDEITAMIESVK